MKHFYHLINYLLLGFLLTSCASYKKNIMFKIPEGFELKKLVESAEKNYTIHENDYLSLEVYTNDGERIIDPNLETIKDLPPQTETTRPTVNYLVDINGVVKFPMLGNLKVAGLTIRQSEEILQKEYARFYQQPFVVLKFINKRVFVLGSPGGLVVPLANENTRLVEVLALAKGLDKDANANNIRLLRGSQIFVIDFGTVEGYLKGNLIMEPGDVVYVEPIRRPFSEGLRDYGPLVSIITSLTTLIVVINSTK